MVKLNTAVLVTKPKPREEKPVKCGYCLTGSHAQCPGGTRGMQKPVAKVWICSCTECNGGQSLRCLECKNATPGEINPDSWACYDVDACEARRQKALKANPAYQVMDEIEESRRMARVAAGKPAETATRAPAAPKTGVCLVTGEPTKGGLFKPGMDARYVSERVAEVVGREVGVVAQRKRLKADGVSDALQAKFEKALTIATDKAARAKEAEKAKPVKAAAKRVAPKKAAKPAPVAEVEDDEDGKTDDDDGF